jgi:hypothetical protein
MIEIANAQTKINVIDTTGTLVLFSLSPFKIA